MPERSPSLVARVLSAVAGELGELGETAAEAPDLTTRLELARQLLEWAGGQLTAGPELGAAPGGEAADLTAGPAPDRSASGPAEREPTADDITGYLRRRNPSSADEAHQVRIIHGGYSKRTILVAGTLDGVPREIVIRQVPAGRGARSLSPEFEVVRAVYAAGIPVPEPLWIEPGANELGGPFFVTRRVSGENFGDVWGATGVSKEIATEIAQIYAQLHRTPADGLRTPVAPRSTPGELRETLAWQEETLHKRGLAVEPDLAALFAWLRDHIPAAAPQASLLHGDAAFSNLLIESGQVSAVLDWEMAHLGDPAEELAYLRPSVEPILPWQDFLDQYERAGGRRPDPAALRFFEVWSYVWRYIGCLWLSQNFDATGRYASAVAAYVHGPRFLRQAVHSAFSPQALGTSS